VEDGLPLLHETTIGDVRYLGCLQMGHPGLPCEVGLWWWSHTVGFMGMVEAGEGAMPGGKIDRICAHGMSGP
jgi:hypothetical protein